MITIKGFDRIDGSKSFGGDESYFTLKSKTGGLQLSRIYVFISNRTLKCLSIEWVRSGSCKNTRDTYSTRNVNLYISIYPILSCVYPILSCVFPILSCMYPIRFSVYPIVKTVYQVLRLSCIRFCVYQFLRLSCIRFWVYRVNRNTSAFSWTNKRKIQRSPACCYNCRFVKYCGFLFAVTICSCFLKQEVYQYYYKSNLINCLLTALYFIYIAHVLIALIVRFHWKYLRMKIIVCFDVLTMSPQSKYLPIQHSNSYECAFYTRYLDVYMNFVLRQCYQLLFKKK